MKRQRRRPITPITYTLLDEMTASTREPLPAATIRHQLSRMWGGLAAIETSPTPTVDDWRVCSDAVNLMETLITTNNGWWHDCEEELVQVRDTAGLLQDAMLALSEAGMRRMKGGPIRLDARGIQAVRAVLEDYAAILEVLPARAMVRCHRLTERRIREILAGKNQPHDVKVVAI